MDRIALEPGRVVLSCEGRDRGRYFIVLEVPDETRVVLADGQSHTLQHPKKKNVKHVKAKPVRMDLNQSFPSGHMLDSDLRTFLHEHGFGLERPLCKED
jgi:ribosomal protein L14E/L6E/L27E